MEESEDESSNELQEDQNLLVEDAGHEAQEEAKLEEDKGGEEDGVDMALRRQEEENEIQLEEAD